MLTSGLLRLLGDRSPREAYAGGRVVQGFGCQSAAFGGSISQVKDHVKILFHKWSYFLTAAKKGRIIEARLKGVWVLSGDGL